MDPVAHTLVGATLAEAGLKRRTALGTATLLIGANLPDLDVLSFVRGETFALSFRRGWTHGVLALVVFPFLLTAAMMLWDRYVRRARAPARPAAVPRQLLLLASIALLTHPALDYLNVYGMRWLMPFSDRWFYGDVLFIVDPWVWAILAGGVFLARRAGRRTGAAAEARSASAPVQGAALDTAVPPYRRSTHRPARIALGLAGLYIGLMAANAIAARWVVWRALPFSRAGVSRIMVAPMPVNPLRKYVVLDEGNEYRVGEFTWTGDPRIRYSDMAVISRRGRHEDAARATEHGRRVLSWARFPLFEPEPGTNGRRVHIIDARYTLDADAPFGARTVEVDPE